MSVIKTKKQFINEAVRTIEEDGRTLLFGKENFQLIFDHLLLNKEKGICWKIVFDNGSVLVSKLKENQPE